MKTKVLIIEDNHYKLFTTKQVLESQLKMAIQVVDAASSMDFSAVTRDLDPDLIVFRPAGGVAELLGKMKKRRTNCRNTEITILVTQEFDEDVARSFRDLLTKQNRRIARAA